ncbi:MAG: IclR family transcriptional regulator [Microbacteriaceae bacterium]|nr:MAG: IclR family transcriptional regulator [Microbacteriaceae bacterium]
MAAQRTKGVDSARRALQILLQFSESKPELSVDELLELHDISLPSVYRYLSLLREMQLIEERSKGTFVLSPQILKLARAAELTLDYRAQVQPLLNRLTDQTGETSLYLRRINNAAVCQAISETDHAISISFRPGHVMALHAGAGAKMLLSDYAAAKREQYLDRCIPPLTKRARERLTRELEGIRSAGFAESHGEVDNGVWACAAPVQFGGEMVGVISVVAPVYRTDDGKREVIAQRVRDTAAEMARAIELGH